MILIDNYDSFTYNIVYYLKELGIKPIIFQNNNITIEQLKKLNFTSIIISPGPKKPTNAGISLDVIKHFYKTKKILGICLGHQCIGQYFGSKIIKDKNPFHGKTSQIFFDTHSELFKNMPQGFLATRYHSLIIDKAPKNFKISARTSNNIIMAIEHNSLPIYGVQFHPESILTENGINLIKNFINM